MAARRRHEREMKELEVQQAVSTSGGSTVINNGHGAGRTSAKLPKLSEFIDGKDDLDSYLQRFERFARRKK